MEREEEGFEFALIGGDRHDHGWQWIEARVQVLVVLSLSLFGFGVDHGNGLKVNLKCKQFYTSGLPILRSRILIFGLTKFSVQTKPNTNHHVKCFSNFHYSRNKHSLNEEVYYSTIIKNFAIKRPGNGFVLWC